MANGVEKALADAPVVVEDAVALGLAGAERDVHPLGQPPLEPPDLLGVKAELSTCAGFPCRASLVS